MGMIDVISPELKEYIAMEQQNQVAGADILPQDAQELMSRAKQTCMRIMSTYNLFLASNRSLLKPREETKPTDDAAVEQRSQVDTSAKERLIKAMQSCKRELSELGFICVSSVQKSDTVHEDVYKSPVSDHYLGIGTFTVADLIQARNNAAKECQRLDSATAPREQASVESQPINLRRR